MGFRHMWETWNLARCSEHGQVLARLWPGYPAPGQVLARFSRTWPGSGQVLARFSKTWPWDTPYSESPKTRSQE